MRERAELVEVKWSSEAGPVPGQKSSYRSQPRAPIPNRGVVFYGRSLEKVVDSLVPQVEYLGLCEPLRTFAVLRESQVPQTRST